MRQKRATELRRKLLLSKMKKEEEEKIAREKPESRLSPRETVRKVLVGRAVEVMEAARRYYPNEIEEIEASLAELIENGRLRGAISGEELYVFLRRAGLRFSLETKIRIAEGGELKTLDEKLRGIAKDQD